MMVMCVFFPFVAWRCSSMRFRNVSHFHALHLRYLVGGGGGSGERGWRRGEGREGGEKVGEWWESGGAAWEWCVRVVFQVVVEWRWWVIKRGVMKGQNVAGETGK